MKVMQLIGISAAAVLSFSLVLLAPGTSAADREVNSGEILLLSDEILGNSVEIERAGGSVPPTNGVPGGLPDGPAPVPPRFLMAVVATAAAPTVVSETPIVTPETAILETATPEIPTPEIPTRDSDSGDSDGDSDSDSDSK